MRVLIFNPDEKGHNFVFLKLLIPALHALGCDITLAITRQGFASEEFRTHLAPLGHLFQADTEVTTGLGKESRGHRIGQLALALTRARPAHLLVPNAEPLLALLGLYSALGRAGIPSGVTCAFTLVRADFAYPAVNVKQRAWFWAKERSIAAVPKATISLIDPIAYENIRRRGSTLAGRISLLPEPLDDVTPIGKAEARRRLGIPVEGRYIACAGVLDPRKGVDLVIQAFAQANLRPDDKLLLGGKAGPEIAELLNRQPTEMVRKGKIVLLDRYLSDEELNWVICASDVVAATYRASHRAPSGIINKAAVIGRPVLASRFGWSDIMVPEFGLGALTDIDNLTTFADDITRALEQSGSFVPSPKTARLREYLSPEDFAAAWTAGIAQRLGRPAPQIKTWEWVRAGAAH